MNKFIKILLLAIISLISNINAQNYIFFNDSPNNTYYETSWGFMASGSTLELINGSKFPVDAITKYSGLNSLRLKWKSVSGGDWGVATAGQNWVARDVTQMDSIVFYTYSANATSITDLPLIFIEDVNNNKTPKHKISDYVTTFNTGTWNKITVPISIFVANPGSANLTQIKTIYFGQNSDATFGVENTLYIDELTMTKGGSFIPDPPQNVKAKGYYKHIELSWDLSTQGNIAGYRVYKLVGGSYQLVGTANYDNKYYIDFIGTTGLTETYKVAVISTGLNESPLSEPVIASTHDMTDDEWLDMLQEANFRYFWDYAHPVSGLARERYGSGNTVTIGGSGFGVMAILVGIERGFITREEGATRILKIVNFLKNKAQRFHGVWSHWLNGETGTVIPFSQYDDGGDLVESSFMFQGLLAVRQYFDQSNPQEDSIRQISTTLWEEAEFDWYRRYTTGSYLYWHWSPNYGWQMNFQLKGPNETQICYLLGIASPTHSVPASLYSNGWASSSNYTNSKTFYGYRIYVGWDYGGPLFFTHYSFLGFDPRHKKDNYTNYFINNRNIALVHNAYSIANPNGFTGYNAETWGLTASDDPTGYRVHEPVNDNGTLTPTAALSSFPYTPVESMAALKSFYNNYGEKIWGIYGFTDAFNPKLNWYASSFLAIDQGPIIVMTENYRSGLLWNNFMKNPEIQPMLTAIGFVPDSTTDVEENLPIASDFELMGNYPNPFNPTTTIVYSVPKSDVVKVDIYDMLGNLIATPFNGNATEGRNRVDWNGFNSGNERVSSGIYIYRVSYRGNVLSGKMIMLK